MVQNWGAWNSSSSGSPREIFKKPIVVKKNEAKEITRVVCGLTLARPRESLLSVSIWDRDLTLDWSIC